MTKFIFFPLFLSSKGDIYSHDHWKSIKFKAAQTNERSLIYVSTADVTMIPGT